MPAPLHGLVAAAHSPFHADGSLNLAAVERQAAHLLSAGVGAVFICGSTGESHSLTVTERLELAKRWTEVARGAPLRVVVHVGTNCLSDAQTLAAHAQKHSAAAVAALAPSYFKPRTLDHLIASMAQIAASAPETPFYYYDIPALTGVTFSAADFLTQAAPQIPNLAGVKFTNFDLAGFQLCLRALGGRFDVPFGCDEFLLGALALGGRGAVGSGFNFAGPIYNRLFAAFARGDLETARTEQFRGVQLIQLLAGYGYLSAAKAVMKMLSVDVGPARLPLGPLPADQTNRLRSDLESLGFFGWLKSSS